MTLIKPPERPLATAIAKLAITNPFLPVRIATERQILGPDFVDVGSDWNVRPGSQATHPNLVGLEQRTQRLVNTMHERLRNGVVPDEHERPLYELIVVLLLYYRYREQFDEVVNRSRRDPTTCAPVECFDDFERDARRLLDVPGAALSGLNELPHLFAIFFQIRRAFFAIFTNIIGVSAPIVTLRSRVWQSIFGHDLPRYRRVLFEKTNDVTTLVTGPSGTGKELVARAIGLSHYVPFDPATRTFAENYTGLFRALNISALSPTLVESELFGHRRGAFTGAIADRSGWLEQCSPLGTVFLDEIGELEQRIQVKLLRVLQTRSFEPIGGTETSRFPGRIVAATNRDLRIALAQGTFRPDFFYRLCSDMIAMPTLREQLDDAPEQLRILVAYLATRVVGEEEAGSVAEEVVAWIDRDLGLDYDWPGNVRELEQCVRNVVMHSEYHPLRSVRPDPREQLARSIVAGSLSAEELMRAYCTLVYSTDRSYEGTAQRLGIDRRTVKSRIDHAFLEQLS